MSIVRSSSYILPDGRTVISHVWSCDSDCVRYTANVNMIKSLYRDLSFEEAINRYAITRFMLFHGISYEPAYESECMRLRRASIG